MMKTMTKMKTLCAAVALGAALATTQAASEPKMILRVDAEVTSWTREGDGFRATVNCRDCVEARMVKGPFDVVISGRDIPALESGMPVWIYIDTKLPGSPIVTVSSARE